MSSPALSKSLFKLGLTCPIKLKHALARPALPRQADGNEYMQQLARGGYMFEKLVKVYYPGEDMLVPTESHADASARTLTKIKAAGGSTQVLQLATAESAAPVGVTPKAAKSTSRTAPKAEASETSPEA